jgi:hypothetical protein
MPVTRRGRQRFEQTEPDDDLDDEPTPDGAGAAGESQPSTSLADLTTEADPQQFDQTFTAGDANLTIQGRYDPVAGSRQVIPRVAYVLNYNLIYNESRDRWEPQKKGSLGGTDPTTVFPTSGINQTIPNGLVRTTLEFTDAHLDELDGFDAADNSITVPETGAYLLAFQIRLGTSSREFEIDVFLERNSNTAIISDNAAQQTGGEAVAATTIQQADAGDTYTLEVQHNSSQNEDIIDGLSDTYLTIAQVA